MVAGNSSAGGRGGQVLPTVRPRPPSAPRMAFQIPFFGTNLTFAMPFSEDGIMSCVTTLADFFVYLLGPLLILLATAIAGGLTYAYFDMMVPMMVDRHRLAELASRGSNLANLGVSGGGGGGAGAGADAAGAADSENASAGAAAGGWMAAAFITPAVLFHTLLVLYFLLNVVHNYLYCVKTPNRGPHFDRVVRELADATGFSYPETEEEVRECKREYERKLIERGRRRREAAVRVRRAAGAAARVQQVQQATRASSSTAVSGPSSATAGAAAAENGTAAAAAACASSDGVPPAASQTAQQLQHRAVAGADANANAGSGCNSSGPTQSSGAAPTAAPAAPTASTSTSATPSPASTTAAQPTRTSPRPAQPGWTLLSPTEWGYCLHSNQPKPPRSHYDHVTKCLVLNMDHYCPWMFNTVGYFNYRYFLNFLLYVFLGMLYGFSITLTPFRNMNGPMYREQIQLSKAAGHDPRNVIRMLPMVPLPEERTALTFAFMICLSVGLAVLCLLGFHCYLLFTAQTTIEFHGNFAKKRGARRRGTRWTNPYSLGWKRNWQQIYGSRHPLLALLPSSREPEFLPVPIAGELGRRHPKSKEEVLPLLRQERRGSGGGAAAAMNGSSSSDGTRRRGVALSV